MPIARIADKLIFFAHVPKCGGTAVGHYLIAEFGPLAFHDGQFNTHSPRGHWTRSSPQHVEAQSLARLFLKGFFDASFAVVRHPVTRFLSVFRFQRDIEGRIAADMPFSDWIALVERKRKTSPWQFDNHTRMMTEIVPQEAVLFRLADGLEKVAAWLQDIAGPDRPLLPVIEERNVLSDRLKRDNIPDNPVTPSREDVEAIARFYQDDFERFGYQPDAWREVT